MIVFRAPRAPKKEIDMWCWQHIGPGGQWLKQVDGCDGFEDPWDGDLWQNGLQWGYMVYRFKDEKHATLFALKWMQC
jgi:hypothetical protein